MKTFPYLASSVSIPKPKPKLHVCDMIHLSTNVLSLLDKQLMATSSGCLFCNTTSWTIKQLLAINPSQPFLGQLWTTTLDWNNLVWLVRRRSICLFGGSLSSQLSALAMWPVNGSLLNWSCQFDPAALLGACSRLSSFAIVQLNYKTERQSKAVFIVNHTITLSISFKGSAKSINKFRYLSGFENSLF